MSVLDSEQLKLKWNSSVETDAYYVSDCWPLYIQVGVDFAEDGTPSLHILLMVSPFEDSKIGPKTYNKTPHVVLYSGKEDSSLMNALLAAEKEYFGFVAAIKSAIKSPLVYTRT